MEAIVLAGGKGTRLASVVSDIPKPMASVNNIPFLTYLLRFLTKNGATHLILSIGYKGEIIQNHFGTECCGAKISYCPENTPLGTGGAVQKALGFCKESDVLLLNGDTFFNVDISEFLDFHRAHGAQISMVLKEMAHADRYGTVELVQHRIMAFREKQYAEHGYINGGVYMVKRDLFAGFQVPERFSFEQFVQDNTENLQIYGMPSKGNFIDIGIPEEYAAAQTLIPQWIQL